MSILKVVLITLEHCAKNVEITSPLTGIVQVWDGLFLLQTHALSFGIHLIGCLFCFYSSSWLWGTLSRNNNVGESLLKYHTTHLRCFSHCNYFRCWVEILNFWIFSLPRFTADLFLMDLEIYSACLIASVRCWSEYHGPVWFVLTGLGLKDFTFLSLFNDYIVFVCGEIFQFRSIREYYRLEAAWAWLALFQSCAALGGMNSPWMNWEYIIACSCRYGIFRLRSTEN